MVVAHRWGRQSFELLQGVRKEGMDGAEATAAAVAGPHSWKEYGGMGHGMCDEELADVAAFLKGAFEK